jgi:PAS domain S-box-containing protein
MKLSVFIVWLFLYSVALSNNVENSKTNTQTDYSLFTQEEKEYLKKKKVITICILKDSYPIEFFENGKHQGVVGDIFTIFKSYLPIPIQLVPVHNTGEAQKYLSDGTCDIKSLVIKEAIPYNYILTTKPYLNDPLVLMTTNDKPYVRNLNENLKDKKFVVRHKAYQIFLQKQYPYLKNIEVISEQKKIAELLEEDEIYGYIDLAMISNHFIEHFFLNQSVKVNSNIEQSINLSIGIVNTEKPLLPIFDKLITKLSKEYIQNLKSSTTVFYQPKEIDNTLVWRGLGVFFVLFGIVFVFILKQTRLKNEIKEQKETFEKLYLKSSDSVLLIENNIFIDCNEATLAMLGYDTKEQLFGLNSSAISPKYQPDGRLSSEKAKEMIDIAIQNGSYKFEWVHTKLTGEEFWVEVVLTTIKLANKNIIHGLWRNIDERKKLEHQSKLLAHQSKKAALGRLISLIAHQWRQPLSMINGITSQTYHDLGNPSVERGEIKTKLLQIENITGDLSKAINKIHDFYVYDEDTNEAGTAIKEIIDECVEILYPSFANSLQPHLIINEIDSIKISGYTYGMHQIILTLLTNCEEIFALRNIVNPLITIDLYKENGFSYIAVKDNGGGIEKEIEDKIFEPFISSKNRTNRIRGLGLSIAKDIVENHLKGIIKVANLEDGAIFTIRYKEYDKQ